ncbi:hypothetical protein ACHAQH_004922 [Verticillium albo-atrum]
MSVDLNWETLTSGPDGEALALRIRDFIHEKFQAVQLPRFIKSVTVHDFEFGSIPPQLELKDITDPLPDFYEDNEDYDDESDDGQDNDAAEELRAAAARRHQNHQRDGSAHLPSRLQNHGANSPSRGQMAGDLTSPFLGVSTPGILSGASNLHYFQSHLGSGWSGTHTPLAAVAGGGNSWMDASAVSSPGPSPLRGTPTYPSHSRNPSQSSVLSDVAPAFAPLTPQNPHHPSSAYPFLREKSSVSTLAPTSVGTSRPPTRDPACAIDEEGDDDRDGQQPSPPDGEGDDTPPRFREPRPDDLQAVFRIRYAGDVRLRLTAEILLDYPMPSFVGIPVQLSVTGLTFDGVGVTAHIRKRVHFCFLSPEDAITAVGLPEEDDEAEGAGGEKRRFGGLLQEIRVESEIGLREGGKQSLKNVGKVERFVLEQVRRIFENEFVYPSFWTFLV